MRDKAVDTPGWGNASTVSTCALCEEQRALQVSHVIPNAVFRRIKQAQNSGQLIFIDDSQTTPILRSQETWSERLLCVECERIIGGYEQYGLELLRGHNRKSPITECADGLSIRAYDYPRLKLFLTSMLWRAAISRHEAFTKVILSAECHMKARASLLTGNPLPALRLGCTLRRLIDSTPKSLGGFDQQNLRQLVISPIPRLQGGRNCYSILFVIEGYLLEFFVRSVPFKAAGQRGCLKDGSVLSIPNVCIFTVPEILSILVSGYSKHDRGLVAF